MKKKIVIVGGVAGGATAAARLRRLSEEHDIIMIERGEYISFANCGLPYYIGGEIKEREALLLQTPEAMNARFRIDVRVKSEVQAINREKKELLIRKEDGTKYSETYDILILSTGAKPFVPKMEGLDSAKNVFTLRNMADTDKIKNFLLNEKPSRAVVIGGGFIGIEMAENLTHAGLEVHLVEMADQVMAPLDREMAAFVHRQLRQQGVQLHLQNGVRSLKDNRVTLNDGSELDTDLTILAIGVVPENELAKASGLAIGERGGVQVNEQLQSVTDPAIYVIGDVMENKSYLQGGAAQIPLAGPANRQGRLVADHIMGKEIRYRGSLGTAVAKVFDISVATTGENEKVLQRLGVPYQVIHTHPNSHAGYYPNAEPIHLKIIYSPQSKQILGAQAVGGENGVKAIDIIATAIMGGLKVTDLQELELAYAPPYSSAKAPVNFLGYIAENIENGEVETFQWHEVEDLLKQNAFFLDSRDEIENEVATISGSWNIPVNRLRQEIDRLPKDRTIYTFCKVGVRGYLAARILKENGFDVKNLDGGFDLYSVISNDKQAAHMESKDRTEAGEDKMEQNQNNTMPQAEQETLEIDACGLQCPGPIMQVFKGMETLKHGDFLKISVTDIGFLEDIKAWCDKTGNRLINIEKDKKRYVCVLQKVEANGQTKASKTGEEDGATLVVFSGDMDKAMASFIIASGAASMGKKVTMFFTFWGLNIIKKTGVKLPKQGMEKMFSAMLPKDASGLPLSKMNMGGMGAVMMKKIMKEKNVDSLPILIQNAMDMGVKIIACSMSMDVMGIRREELMDGVEIGGVATYLGKTNDSNLNLFI